MTKFFFLDGPVMGDRASLSHIFFDRLQEGIRKLTGFDFRYPPPFASSRVIRRGGDSCLARGEGDRFSLPSDITRACPNVRMRAGEGLLAEGVKRIKFGSHPQIGTLKGKEGEQEQSSSQKYGQEQCFLRQPHW